MKVLIVVALLFVAANAESICKSKPEKGKGFIYDMTYQTLCYQGAGGQCLGVSPDFGHAAVCALGSGMCGVDRQLHKETTLAGRLLPIIVKLFPFLGDVSSESLACALVQQSCCRASAESLNKADTIISYIVEQALGDVKKVTASLDEISGKSLDILLEKGREMLKEHPGVQDMIKWYNKIVNIGKALGVTNLKNLTDYGKMIKDYSQYVQEKIRADNLVDNICDNLLQKIQKASVSEAYVNAVKAICGDFSDMKSPEQCKLVKTDVASPLICIIGSEMCKIPFAEKHYVLHAALRFLGVAVKIIPGLEQVANNGFTCAIVENACCRASNASLELIGGKFGKFEIVNRVLDEAFDGDSAKVLDAIDTVSNKAGKIIEKMAAKVWKTIYQFLSKIGKAISDAWCWIWHC